MTAVQTESNYHNGGSLMKNMIPYSTVQERCMTNFKYIYKETENSLNNMMNTHFQPLYPIMETIEIPKDKGLNGFRETFVKPCPFPTTNGKTADITSLSVNSSKNSKKMPETRENAPNARYPIMDPGKHRQVNCINFNRKLCQSIEEAVQNISRFWQSGYSNKNGIKLPETFWDMGPYWPPPFYPPVNQSIYPRQPYHMPHSFHGPNIHYQPLQTNHCMSSKRPQGINNMKKMFTPAKIKKTYEETHWFKVKNTRVHTPKRIESNKETLNLAMSPVITDITLPSTCKSKKDYSNNNNTKKTGMSLDCAATSGDLAANKCQMPDIDQQVCKPNYHNRRSEYSAGFNSYESGFSPVSPDDGYQADIEPDNFSLEEFQDHFPLSPKSPRFDLNFLSNSSASDAESSGISSDDESEIEFSFIKNPNDSKDEVKNTRINTLNLTKESNKVLKINKKPLTPVLSDPTLLSSCKSQQNGYNLKDDIYCLATSGDLAANSCQMLMIRKQNENEIYSFSDSSFSSVYHKNDFESDIESDDCFSKDTVHFSVAPSRSDPDLLLLNSLDSDTESSDLYSDSEDEYSNHDLERADDEIDSYLHSRWLMRPNSEESLVFSQDDEDDWDTIWSSNEPELEANDFFFMREFNPITVKFTTCCAAPSSKEEKADVPAVEADYGIHQKIQEANEKWNKVYNNDYDLDSTSKDNQTPKVQFATGKKLTTRHLLVCWTYAYKAARISPWITLALDSHRFQKRIEELKPTIDPILDPVHRQNIFTSRLQQEAESM